MITTVPTPPQVATSGDSSAAAVPVVDPPEWVSSQPAVSVQQGTVQGTSPQGVVTVQTANGPLSFVPPTPLPPGAPITLQLQQSPQPQVVITQLGQAPTPITVDQTPPVTLPPSSQTWPPAAIGDTLTATIESAPATTSSASAFSLAATASADATPGGVLPGGQATALTGAPASLLAQIIANDTPIASLPGSAPPAAASLGSGLQSPTAATTLTTLLAAETGSSTPLTIPNSPLGAVSTAPGTPGTQAAAPLGDLGRIAAGDRLTVRILSITPPSGTTLQAETTATATATGTTAAAATTAAAEATAARAAVAAPQAQIPAAALAEQAAPVVLEAAARTAAAASASTTISATVVGSDAAGRTVLSTGQVVLTLPVAQPPIGSTLTLAWNVVDPVPITLGTSTVSPMQAAAAALAAAAQGTAAQAAVSAALPRMGPTLAAQMAFFASAAQKADLRSLLGEEPRSVLERSGKGKSALKQMADELSRSGEDRGPGWRALTMPVGDGAQVQPVRLFLHGTNPDAEDEAAAKKKGGSGGIRFLIDLDLSKLGPLQLDGLARKDRLDLVIRTPDKLAEPVRQGIQQVFTSVAAARGITGQTIFQVAPPVVPQLPSEAPVPTHGILV